MKPRERLILMGVLVGLGAGWGVTQPLAKIAVSEGYRHFGLVFWQMVVGSVLLWALTLLRRRPLPFGAPYLRLYGMLAVVGTVIPNSAGYQAAVHLPSGILSIVLSLVPMISFPIALMLGVDQFRWRRLAGLSLGLSGVLLLTLPGAEFGTAGMLIYLPLAMIAPCLYALEGNLVAKWGTLDLDPIQTLAGTSVVGAIIAGPLAIATGHWISPMPPWGAPDAAMVLLALIHAIVYTAYVWLVGHAGSVFAVQVSYLVTGFGMFWAMLLLGERYSGMVWLAMLTMFAGLALVQPRRKRALSPDDPSPKMTEQ